MRRPKLVRILFKPGSGAREYAFPLLVRDDLPLRSALAAVLPPTPDPDAWTVTGWDSPMDMAECKGAELRGGTWLGVGRTSDITGADWRCVLPDPTPMRDLDVQIYHRSLVSIRPIRAVPLPPHQYLHGRLLGERCLLLHDSGLVALNQSNPQPPDILFEETGVRMFDFDENGRIYTLLSREVRWRMLEQPGHPASAFEINEEEGDLPDQGLVGFCLVRGELWMARQNGQLFSPSSNVSGNLLPDGGCLSKAIYTPLGWLAFDRNRDRLVHLTRVSSDPFKILDDSSGSVQAFDADSLGRVYYVNGRDGLCIHAIGQGLIATMRLKRLYEPFACPSCLFLDENHVFVVDGEELLEYQLEWEK